MTGKLITYGAWLGANALDAWSSSRFFYRGGREGTELFTDEYGDFSMWRYAVFATAVLAGAITANELVGSWIPGAVIVVLGSMTRVIVSVFKNLKNARNNRRLQWSDLIDLRETGVFDGKSFLDEGGRYRYRLYQWIYVDGGTEEEAKAEIVRRLKLAVLEPEDNWFKRPWFERY